MKMEQFDINRVYALLDAYKSGRLGGEKIFVFHATDGT